MSDDSDFEYDESASDLDLYSDEMEDGMEDTMGEHTRSHVPMVEFTAHSTAELAQRMAGQAREIAEVLGLSEEDTITLLHHFKWNSERLMESYITSPEKVLSEAGVSISNGNNKSGFRHYDNAGDFTCPICCDDCNDSYQLSCSHEFCIPCYRRYIEEHMQQGEVIRCMSCDLSLDHKDVDTICGKGASNKLLESSIKMYVERHKTYQWCPSPDCGIIVEVMDPVGASTVVSLNKVPVAICSHGHEFCWACGLENHMPAPCNVADLWVRKCRDDSETIKWIVSNTKKCAKCETSIEKNGGCNHMTCKKCAFEFCWICLGEWSKHGSSFFQCNRYKIEEKKQEVSNGTKNAAKVSLARYLHYYEFFTVHESSAKGDAKRCAEVEKAVRAIQEASGISWIEAQFLAESATALLRARRVLKWSYPTAFYCNRTTYLELFEDVQARLADAVEALSKLFEIEDPLEIVEKKLEFKNKAQRALDCQKAMCSCTDDTIKNGTLDVNE